MSNHSSDDMIASLKQSLKAMDVQRQAIESEAAAIISELTTAPSADVPPAGIDTPLVDAEGFPRGDIDLYRVRSLRGRLAELKTDRSRIMADLERSLHQLSALQSPSQAARAADEYAARRLVKPKPKYDTTTGKWVVANWDGSVAGVEGGEQRRFEQLQETATSTVTESLAAVQMSTPPTPSTPFARINSVDADSPAAQAGLMTGDLVVRFGTITSTDDAPLTKVGVLVPVAAGERQSIEVQVDRDDGTRHVLALQPRPWQGRGLLGCHVVPV